MAYNPVKTTVLTPSVIRFVSSFAIIFLLIQGLAQTRAAAQSPASPQSPSTAQPSAGNAISPTGIRVIGYYAGRNTAIDSFPVEKLTHIIFSFCHLKGNRLNVNNANDSTIIRHLVSLKSRNPGLKVILSLGGWGGCMTCPAVFATKKGRNEFTRSVQELTEYFHTDGIDLDWEYPSLPNVPGYVFYPEDKDHFTLLIRRLRKKLGRKYEISFAAGGLTRHLEGSIDWKKVTPYVNYINLMSYDLVSGYDTVTGHHTPLYSTPQQVESTDHGVRFLDSIGVPLNKVAIGVAFYARIFGGVDSVNNGLYRPGRFYRGVSYKNMATELSKDSGYIFHWDPIARAPYMYNAGKQQFVTFDDTLSIRLKSRYALDKHLGGIMFWQLAEDQFTGGLLDVIDNTKKEWLQTKN